MGEDSAGLTFEQRGAELRVRCGSLPVFELLWDCDGAVDLWDVPVALSPNQVVHVANVVPAALVGSADFRVWVGWLDSTGWKSIAYPPDRRSPLRAPQ